MIGVTDRGNTHLACARPALADQKPPRRNTQTGRPSTTAARSPAARPDSRASALQDAISHAVGADREFKTKSSVAAGSRQTGLILLALLMGVFAAYSFIAKPAFIWGAPVAAPPPDVQEANLRMSMFLFGMRVDRYKLANRSYPESLAELGDSIRGISYQRLSDSTFELRGTAANRDVVFRNDMRQDDFLGNSRELIQSRGRK
jgi:hypothetical protein